jgi:Zn-dependent protease with chaperone function
MRLKFSYLIFLSSLFLLLSFARPIASQAGNEAQGRDSTEEEEILDRLNAISPAAVPIFQAATQAMDSGEYTSAKQGYEEVLRFAPGFPDAERRLSYVEAYLGNFEASLTHAQNAFDADPSPNNHMGLARALLNMNNLAQNQAALEHARAAVQAVPGDVEANLVLVMAASANNENELERETNARVLELAPQNPIAHYFAGIHAAQDRRWEKAEAELRLSQKLGMPAEIVQEALDSGVHSQALLFRGLRWTGYILIAWLAVFAVLFLAGVLLSNLTLRAIRQAGQAEGLKTGKFEQFVRTLYRLVIMATSTYFYLSIPILLLVVAGVAGAIIYLFFAIGQIPVRLVAIVGILAVYTLFIVIRSLFIRIRDEEPGRSLLREEAPELWALTGEVARRVGTRPVDAIFITPGSEVAVTERGDVLKKLRGQGQRCLILGLGTLDGMTQGQLRAVLAHEYGHFSNRDTAGGSFARQVLASLHKMGFSLAASGLARWYNPAWLFVNSFRRIFLRITLGASRLQEMLADRHAALAYGSQTFIEGLKQVIQQAVRFNFITVLELQEALQQGIPLHNLYSLPAPQSGELQAKLDNQINEALNQPTRAYDSHPSLSDRVKALENIQPSGSDDDWENQSPAWELLPNAEALQNEMTAVVQGNVDQQRRVAGSGG